MEHLELWNRLINLSISDIKEYQKCKNPNHARLVNILNYSTNCLHFYQYKRISLRHLKQTKNIEDQWLLKEIKLLQDLNKALKSKIKQSNKNYNK